MGMSTGQGMGMGQGRVQGMGQGMVQGMGQGMGQGIVGMPGVSPVGEMFTGMVKSYSDANGWGFIQCPKTQEMYGKDIMLLRGDLPGGTVMPGAQVSFTVAQGKKGPIANNVQIHSAGNFGGCGGCGGKMNMGWKMQGAMPGGNMIVGQPYKPAGTMMQFGGGAAMGGKGMGGGMPGMGMGGMSMMPPMGAVKATGGNEFYCGIVKNFDQEKGWGHIQGQALQNLFGKDVFVSTKSLDGQIVEHGSQVLFQVQAGQKGPMAKSVKVLPPGSFSADGFQGATYNGVIKHFQQDKGWGFITCEDVTNLFGKDLFLHKREVPQSLGRLPVAGEQVQFTVNVNSSGRPEAATVVLLDGDPNGGYAPAAAPGQAGAYVGAGPYGISATG
jgi:cold shock CspA family protein